MRNIFVIAEIGINHNGDMDIARKLIDVAVVAGCDAVKFQKRTVEKVYSKELLDSPRESPWGTTQRAQKMGLEFGKEEYDKIDRYCRERGIEWFASAWDIDAQKFLQQYGCRFNKVASAMLTNEEVLKEIAAEKKYTFISTGMSTFDEIDFAVKIFEETGCKYELLHCNSTYPMCNEDANLRVIRLLKDIYKCNVGYSGHEVDELVTLCAVATGASSIERHITLDKTMYGSDQKASIEPHELCKLVRDIREIEKIMGSGEKVVTDAELVIKKKLRG